MSVETIQPFAIASRRARSAVVPDWLHRAFNQVLYITPLFWFMELFQNWGYKLVTGDWGWRYPDSAGRLMDATRPYDWHSLISLLPWASTVIVFSLLEARFARHRLPFLLRMIIAGSIGWVGEFGVGYFGSTLFHTHLQVWTRAPLKYVSISALPIWCLDFLFFHLFTVQLRSARDSSQYGCRPS